MLTVRASKFGKSRKVPLTPGTVQALGACARVRARWLPQPGTPAFFVSTAGTPVAYPHFGAAFRRIIAASGVGAASPVRPRIHDMRHSFAVRTLAGWYRAGEDVSALLPRLSTYLGHRDPVSTYWYLPVAPELQGQQSPVTALWRSSIRASRMLMSLTRRLRAYVKGPRTDLVRVGTRTRRAPNRGSSTKKHGLWADL